MIIMMLARSNIPGTLYAWYSAGLLALVAGCFTRRARAH